MSNAWQAGTQQGILRLMLSKSNTLSRLYSLWSGKEDSYLCLELRPEGDLEASLSIREARRMEWMLSEAADQFLKEDTVSAEGWDERALVYISADKMSAWLVLVPPVGNGRKLTHEELEQQVIHQGVVQGVGQKLLKDLPTISDPYFCLFLLAYGTAPIDGKDGYIVDHISRHLSPFTDPDKLANADYNMLRLVNKIEKGDIICEVIPPTAGIPGTTVTGESIPARDGTKADIPAGRNTVLSEDKKYLLAARSGHVQFSGLNFLVKAVLDIPGNVDRTTGNINFLGDIHIRGDVIDGCTIRAMGNIQIDGVIESATIEAGENLVVSSGIQGQDETVIRAHKSVYAKYLEHCTVYAHNTVQADCIIDCSVNCNGTVRAKSGRGIIIGGTICASKEVFAATIGSRAERMTSIILGGIPCENFERQQLLDEYNKIKEEIEGIHKQAYYPEVGKQISSLEMNLRIAQIKLNRFEKEYQTKFSSQSNEGCAVMADTIYPRLSIALEHEEISIDEMRENCRVVFQNGHLHEKFN